MWLGPEYLLDERLMMLIVLYFFSWMFRIMQLTYRDAAGLWTEDWLKPYVGMAVNLVGSIWMVKATGTHRSRRRRRQRPAAHSPAAFPCIRSSCGRTGISPPPTLPTGYR